jgi:hypothetical protein
MKFPMPGTHVIVTTKIEGTPEITHFGKLEQVGFQTLFTTAPPDEADLQPVRIYPITTELQYVVLSNQVGQDADGTPVFRRTASPRQNVTRVVQDYFTLTSSKS